MTKPQIRVTLIVYGAKDPTLAAKGNIRLGIPVVARTCVGRNYQDTPVPGDPESLLKDHLVGSLKKKLGGKTGKLTWERREEIDTNNYALSTLEGQHLYFSIYRRKRQPGKSFRDRMREWVQAQYRPFTNREMMDEYNRIGGRGRNPYSLICAMDKMLKLVTPGKQSTYYGVDTIWQFEPTPPTNQLPAPSLWDKF